jgi:hypothetical protein
VSVWRVWSCSALVGADGRALGDTDPEISMRPGSGTAANQIHPSSCGCSSRDVVSRIPSGQGTSVAAVLVPSAATFSIAVSSGD